MDKEIVDLLNKAIGDGTVTDFASKSNISRPYLTNILNNKQENPPGPEFLDKIASASDSVTYLELMAAAGYLPDYMLEENPIIPNMNYAENFHKLVNGTFVVGNNRIRFAYDEEMGKPYFFVDTYLRTDERQIEGTDTEIISKRVDIYENYDGFERFDDALEAAKNLRRP